MTKHQKKKVIRLRKFTKKGERKLFLDWIIDAADRRVFEGLVWVESSSLLDYQIDDDDDDDDDEEEDEDQTLVSSEYLLNSKLISKGVLSSMIDIISEDRLNSTNDSMTFSSQNSTNSTEEYLNEINKFTPREHFINQNLSSNCRLLADKNLILVLSCNKNTDVVNGLVNHKLDEQTNQLNDPFLFYLDLSISIDKSKKKLASCPSTASADNGSAVGGTAVESTNQQLDFAPVDHDYSFMQFDLSMDDSQTDLAFNGGSSSFTSSPLSSPTDGYLFLDSNPSYNNCNSYVSFSTLSPRTDLLISNNSNILPTDVSNAHSMIQLDNNDYSFQHSYAGHEHIPALHSEIDEANLNCTVVEKGHNAGLNHEPDRRRNRRYKYLKIAWKHGSKISCNVGDFEVFQQWANYTGKARPCRDRKSERCEKKRMKAAFRCALNTLPNVKELKKKRTIGHLRQQAKIAYEDNFKIYRIEIPFELSFKRSCMRDNAKSTRDAEMRDYEGETDSVQTRNKLPTMVEGVFLDDDEFADGYCNSEFTDGYCDSEVYLKDTN